MKELASIGLTRQEFYERYVTPHIGGMPPWWKFWARVPSVEQYAQNILQKFYQDYPQIIEKRLASQTQGA